MTVKKSCSVAVLTVIVTTLCLFLWLFCVLFYSLFFLILNHFFPLCTELCVQTLKESLKDLDGYSYICLMTDMLKFNRQLPKELTSVSFISWFIYM